jgi:P27 family predicted phage terminase small subunit
MPRKAKNIDNLVSDGKTHLTKTEIAQRQESQLDIGTDKILIPDFVLQEPEAKNLWDSLQGQLIEKKLLNNFTASTFAILCDAWAKYCAASEEVRCFGITKTIGDEGAERFIQNPAVLVMTKMSDILKKYCADFYMNPAAIASYARNNKPAKQEDKFGAEFD